MALQARFSEIKSKSWVRIPPSAQIVEEHTIGRPVQRDHRLMKKKIPPPLENPELLQPLSDEVSEIKPHSHLQKTLSNQTKRNIFIVSIGILLLVLIIIFFGPRLLVQFSLLLQDDSIVTTQEEKKLIFLAPPLLNPIPKATNSAQFKVSGKSPQAKKVRLTINRNNTPLLSVNSDEEFSTIITLTTGENLIKGKALGPNGEESAFSENMRITFTSKAPDLTIESLSDGQTFEKGASPITIRGKTSDNTTVTINSFQAIINSAGEFSYQLPLKGGGNEITIIATDDAGNKTEQKFNVNYSE